MEMEVRKGASSLAMACAIVLGAAVASPAWAQEAPPASAPTAGAAADPSAPPPNAGASAAVPAAATTEQAESPPGEIVVTARKRVESIL